MSGSRLDRRAFVVGAGGMIGAVIGSGPPRPDDEAAVKATVRTLYVVYSEGRDQGKYRSLLTEDYLLLESAVLRRSGGGWRVALLHSTVVEKSGA